MATEGEKAPGRGESAVSESEREEFIEYGISYKGQPPRTGTWTANYDEAARDAAYRNQIHGDTLGPIEILSRTTVITSGPWSVAVRPEVEPVQFQNSDRQTKVQR